MYDTIATFPLAPNYQVRYDFLARCLPIARSITLIKNTVVDNYDEAKTLHNVHLAKGYEGSILRLDTPYVHKRSWGLMKFKDFHDAEANIVNYEEGKGKRKGTIGKFIMQDDDGNIFGCPPGKGYTYDDIIILPGYVSNSIDNINRIFICKVYYFPQIY